MMSAVFVSVVGSIVLLAFLIVLCYHLDNCSNSKSFSNENDRWEKEQAEFDRKQKEWETYRAEFLKKKEAHDAWVRAEERRKEMERAERGTVLWAYKTLECDEDSTNDQIRAAHREAIKKWHPDGIHMNADNSKIKEFVEQGMQDVNLAWEVLQRARGI